jgi:hypothetical protein
MTGDNAADKVVLARGAILGGADGMAGLEIWLAQLRPTIFIA